MIVRKNSHKGGRKRERAEIEKKQIQTHTPW
jgi:hypothetical protein